MPQTEGDPAISFLNADAVRAALSLELAADALARGFVSLKRGGIPRTVLRLPSPDGAGTSEMLLMPAAGPHGAGLKVVTVVRGNPARGLPMIQGLYILMTADGLTPELVIDGAALTGLRTAAVSTLATRYLARPDSRRLVVFGGGVQAAAHVDAMCRTLPIEHVTVVGRSPDSLSAGRLVEELQAKQIDAVAGTPRAVAQADVICTCTTGTSPLFEDRDLQAGTHVNAIGAYRREMVEVPAASLARALLVVEDIGATLVEAGDVVQAIAAGALPAEGFARELHELVSGKVARTSDEQVTVFKSVGLAVEDLIVARAIADAAVNR
jgi:ornithine cyclodeaminase